MGSSKNISSDDEWEYWASNSQAGNVFTPGEGITKTKRQREIYQEQDKRREINFL